jgi:hypothetical protein
LWWYAPARTAFSEEQPGPALLLSGCIDPASKLLRAHGDKALFGKHSGHEMEGSKRHADSAGKMVCLPAYRFRRPAQPAAYLSFLDATILAVKIGRSARE